MDDINTGMSGMRINREIYVPQEKAVEELFESGIASGINFSKYENIPVSVEGVDKPNTIDSFAAAGFGRIIMENITRCKYSKPTPIQKYAIPIVTHSRDLMACAQTGSGKTAAFLLPILHFLVECNSQTEIGKFTQKPQCVIITPTRELAKQIDEEARKYAHRTHIRSVAAYGGASIAHQGEEISRGCHILVATPGRLLDFVEKGKVDLSELKFLILDEADRMLDMGFLPDIRRVISSRGFPPKGRRQTLMFSATFPPEIQHAARDFLNNHLFLTVGMVGGTANDVKQFFYEVSKLTKLHKIKEILSDPERDPKEKTMIFVKTKRNADFLATLLSEFGLPTTSIHGDRLQREREEALDDFKSGRMPIIVATAVAARGLDIPGVAHVINYEMPQDADEYVHRIGRTGRVGNIGRATTFFNPEEDSGIVRPLLNKLLPAGVLVPDWLKERAHIRGRGW